MVFFFFFQAEDGIRDRDVTGVQTCALPIWLDGQEAAERVAGLRVLVLVVQQRAQVPQPLVPVRAQLRALPVPANRLFDLVLLARLGGPPGDLFEGDGRSRGGGRLRRRRLAIQDQRQNEKGREGHGRSGGEAGGISPR